MIATKVTYWQFISGAALASGISLGCLDILFSFPERPDVFSKPVQVLLPLCATSVATTLTLFLLLVLVQLPVRILRLNPLGTVTAVIIMFSTFIVLARLSGVHTFQPTSHNLLRWSAFAILGFSLGSASYCFARSFTPSVGFRRLLVAIASAPLLLGELLAFLWFRFYAPDMFSFLTGNLGWGVLIITMLLSFTVLKFFLTPGLNLALQAVYMGLLVGFSVLAAISSDDYSPTQAIGTSTKHDVPRVIVITVDSLRRDALRCYNPNAVETPNIDALAHDSTLFTNAYAASSWTLPSMASLMTGLSPDVHQSVSVGDIFSNRFTTLAERFRDAGYLTSGIWSSYFIQPRGGFGQGFDTVYAYPKLSLIEEGTIGGKLLRLTVFRWWFSIYISTQELTDLTLNWIESHQDEDFFLWLHYYDPHWPYAPPPDWVPLTKLVRERGPNFDQAPKAREGYFGTSKEDRQWARELYDAEVRYVDSEIGRLLEKLKSLKMYDDTLIVLTTDHGEEFWDHHEFSHGNNMYNELIASPLLIKHSSSMVRVVDQNVSLGSVYPTLLDLCNVSTDKDGHHSYRSLASLLKKDFEWPDVVFSIGNLRYDYLECVVFGKYKYIRSRLSDREELYDLEADPGEQRSLIQDLPDIRSRARTLLENHMTESIRLRSYYLDGEEEERTVPMSPDEEERIKSVGYL